MKTTISAVLYVVLASVLVCAGTLAYYSDTETATSSVETGTLDLIITDGGLCVTGLWNITGGIPGESYAKNEIRVFNDGTIDDCTVQISFELEELEDNDGNITNGYGTLGPDSDTFYGPHNMSQALIIKSMCYKVVDDEGKTIPDGEIWLVSDGLGHEVYNGSYLINTNGDDQIIDLEDLSKQKIKNLPSPKPHNGNAVGSDGTISDKNYAQLDMWMIFSDSRGEPQNDFQGDAINMNIKVELIQNVDD